MTLVRGCTHGQTMSPEEKAEACKALLREKLSVLLKAEKPHPVVTLQQSVSVEQALSASSVLPVLS